MKIFTASTIFLPLLLSAHSAFAFTKTSPFRTISKMTTALAVTKEDLLGAQDAVDKLLREKACGPIMVRLAWHDSGVHDSSITAEWPAAGGADGSIRFEPEIKHGANGGLVNAVNLLEEIHQQFPSVSYADLYQMASARAIETAGGPKIGMRYGRVDVTDGQMCPKEGNLPDGAPGPDGNYGGDGGTASTKDPTPEGHLRKVFYRMGMNDEEIVALSGAHTLGRAYKDRSGLGKEKTKFTDGSMKQKFVDGEEAPYKPGGQSWTDQFLIFDNSYFKIMSDPNADEELLKLKTDLSVFDDEKFRPFAEKFRDDQDAFFASYAKAHKKLSELGSKFVPAEGITLD